MANKNEVELLVSAKDAATKTLDAATKAVEKLNDATSRTSKTVLENDKNLQQLNNSYAEMQNVVGDLSGVAKLTSELQRANQVLTNTEAALKQADQALKDQQSTQTAAANEYKRLQEAVLSQKTAIDTLSASHKRGDSEMVNARDTLRRLQAELKVANAELRSQTTELKRVETARNKSTTANKKASATVVELTTKLKNLGVDTNNLTAEEARLNREIEQSTAAMRKARQESTAYAKELVKADKATRKLGSSTNTTSDKFNIFADNSRKAMSVTQRIRGEVLSLASAYVGLYGAVDGVSKSFKSFNREQAAQNKILAALGGNTKAMREEMAWLKGLAEELGQPLAELEQSYSGFLIAATAQGETVATSRYMFKSLAESASVMKWSTDDLSGAMRAFTQIMSKGKIMSEELQNQLAERFPGAVKLMSTALNMTTGDLLKMMEQGQLSSEMLLGFSLEASKMMSTGLERSVKSLQSEMNRFGSTITLLQRKFLSLNETRVTETFKELSDQLSGPDGEQLITSLANAFDMLLRGVSFTISHLEELKTILKWIVAYQASKAIVGLAGSFLDLANNLSKANKAGKGLKGFLELAARIFVVYASYKGIEFLADPDKQIKDLGDVDGLLKSLGVESNKTRKEVKGLADTLDDFFSFNTIAKAASWVGLGVNALIPQKSYKDAWEQHKKFIADLDANPITLGQSDDVSNKSGVTPTKKSTQPKDDSAELNRRKMALEAQLRLVASAEKTLISQVDTLEQQFLKKTADTYDKKVALIKAKYAELIASATELGLVEQRDSLIKMQGIELEIQRVKELERVNKENAAKRKDQLDEIKAKEDALNATLDIRRMQTEEITRLRAIGDTKSMAAANNIESQLAANDKLTKQMIADIIAAYQAIDDGSPQIEAQIVKWRQLQDTIGQVGANVAVTAEQFNNMIAEGLTGTFKEMAFGLGDALRGVDNLGSAFGRAADAFKEFARDFMIQIGQMIFQQQILNALSGTGVGAALSPATTVAKVNHSGGMAGSTFASRTTVGDVFSQAARYHNGGIPGLKSNEIPTILERGEEVLTRNDPRHALNGGGGTDVQIIDQRGANSPPVDVQRTNNGGIEQIKVIIHEEIKSAMSSGMMDSTMQSNYGAVRRGVKR